MLQDVHPACIARLPTTADWYSFVQVRCMSDVASMPAGFTGKLEKALEEEYSTSAVALLSAAAAASSSTAASSNAPATSPDADACGAEGEVELEEDEGGTLSDEGDDEGGAGRGEEEKEGYDEAKLPKAVRKQKDELERQIIRK
eukprot:Cvel_24541.t3-p1 / transcript=Cvel_24541.t3 / gene=Cvel_24541 / organism=Chromera_velia_CCMP2878 / gene_product=hypothetical protein / transcript_product=hypothetical protein / location=Cvel_scaffold2665:3512-3941(+) / protein_length=143 / sequence_SO=supercontig / SO=protein_coding / is_pseudo=false